MQRATDQDACPLTSQVMHAAAHLAERNGEESHCAANDVRSQLTGVLARERRNNRETVNSHDSGSRHGFALELGR